MPGFLRIMKKGLPSGCPFLFLERSLFSFEVTYIITYKYRQKELARKMGDQVSGLVRRKTNKTSTS